MPGDFFIDVQRGVVFTKAVGVLGRAEAVEHMTRLKAHPNFRPEFRQLADFRLVTTVTLTQMDIIRLARRAIFSPRSKRAFVVKSDWQFGIGRMFGIYREMEGESGIVVFRDMGKALAWLSLTEEPDPASFPRLTPS